MGVTIGFGLSSAVGKQNQKVEPKCWLRWMRAETAGTRTTHASRNLDRGLNSNTLSQGPPEVCLVTEGTVYENAVQVNPRAVGGQYRRNQSYGEEI